MLNIIIILIPTRISTTQGSLQFPLQGLYLHFKNQGPFYHA